LYASNTVNERKFTNESNIGHTRGSRLNNNNYVINSTFRKKNFNRPTRSQETVDVGLCLEMFGCLQSERTIAIRKRKFLNKFSIIHNELCTVFVAIAKTELESCCTDV